MTVRTIRFCKLCNFLLIVISCLFPCKWLAVKFSKTKRAKVFVFTGSKEAGNWGDSMPGFEVNNSRRWSGWREPNSWKERRLSLQACLKKEKVGGRKKLGSSWNKGNGLNSTVILSCFVFRCTSLFWSQENEANNYIAINWWCSSEAFAANDTQ